MTNLRKENRGNLFAYCCRCPIGEYLPNCALSELHKLPLKQRFDTIMKLEQKEVGGYMSKCFTCQEEQYFAKLVSNL